MSDINNQDIYQNIYTFSVCFRYSSPSFASLSTLSLPVFSSLSFDILIKIASVVKAIAKKIKSTAMAASSPKLRLLRVVKQRLEDF